MGGNIEIFRTRPEAEAAARAAFYAYVAICRAEGYTIIEVDGEPQIVSKNAATGADEPDACRTTRMCEIVEQGGLFYLGTPLGLSGTEEK